MCVKPGLLWLKVAKVSRWLNIIIAYMWMYIWWADSARVSNKNVHNSQIISYLFSEMIFCLHLKKSQIIILIPRQ